ncbi:hypothetical protein HU200_008718 [Digitaria exilis]|uniref:Uncharacterized protein n=1 Tax=Digitaria exilis TaxID=1010633 RepID=A0A835FLB6_9POAL|nr:hypothetical protein HU200_008718 [Digitaria exilis]
MQIYAGLDIATNKVSIHDRCSIPHHLIGIVPATTHNFPVRGRMSVVVGGSNSLIHGLLVDYFDSSLDNPFMLSNYWPSLRFQCCLLWIHANELVLKEYLNRHVDNMVDAGLVKELEDYFDTSGSYVQQTGLCKAIGLKSYCDAIAEMKDNTQGLAKTQTAKIRHMIDIWGWPICSSTPQKPYGRISMDHAMWFRRLHGIVM